MWSYSLTAPEEALAVKVGYERQLPYFGDPTRNINYSEGDLWETWQHAVCAGSELALARMIGKKDFIPHVNVFKSREDIDGVCEVRYAFNTKRGLRFTNRDNPFHKYVLLIEGLSVRKRRLSPDFISPPYIALGWMVGVECINDDWIYNEKSWYVPIEQLRPMDTLHG